MANASAKKIDITKVDTVFLSHGHYDHSGGLLTFASANPSADIYMHENAGGEYYSFKEGGERYIGIDKSILTLPNLHLINGNTVIDEELSVFTNVSPKRNWPKGNQTITPAEKQRIRPGYFFPRDISGDQIRPG